MAFRPIQIPWTEQPQGAAQVDPVLAAIFDSLWLLRGAQTTPDLVGNCHLDGIADASKYSDGVSSGGVGLLGNGVESVLAKGLYSSNTLPIRSAGNYFVFAVFTIRAFAGINEAALFRSTSTPTSQGVGLDFFPYTKTFRVLLGPGSWTTNDKYISYITEDVPWFAALRYAAGGGVEFWTGPVGAPARLESSFTWSSGTVGPIGPAYVGGMSYDGGYTVAFPGVIHLVGVSSLPVDASTVTALSVNPWQLFVRTVYLPFGTASTGIPTLSAATAFNIGATYATPRVTITF